MFFEGLPLGRWELNHTWSVHAIVDSDALPVTSLCIHISPHILSTSRVTLRQIPAHKAAPISMIHSRFCTHAS